MDQRESVIKTWLAENRVKGTQLLQRLVQERSVRGEESKAQALIIEKLRRMELALDIWEIGSPQLINHPVFSCDRKQFYGNPNVVGVWKGTGGGRSIILNGHIDVVPEGDRSHWEEDPYSGVVRGGRLYGRGSTDMKGGTVSLLLAIEALKSSRIKLKGDVIFQSVIEEESGGAGTLAAVLRGYRGDGAIIPEPSSMRIFTKQQGSMWFRISVTGRPAHGGTRYEGTSAIEKMSVVINEIQRLEKERNDTIADPLYAGIPIPIPINIGKIQSGQWPSSVPELAIIEGRMGVAPNETIQNAKVEMEACLAGLSEKDEWFRHHPARIEWFGGSWLPGNIDEGHPLIGSLSGSYQKVKGTSPVIEASPWGTDGGILSTVGDTPTVVFGPGTTEAAHDSDEYIVLENVFEAAEIIAMTIMDWCGVAEEKSNF